MLIGTVKVNVYKISIIGELTNMQNYLLAMEASMDLNTSRVA